MQAALRDLTPKAVMAALLASALLACAPVPNDVITETGPQTANASGLEEQLPDTCNLDAYQGFVGQSLATAALPTGIKQRVVKPGAILSQVYEADRVNFYVDANDKITRVICG